MHRVLFACLTLLCLPLMAAAQGAQIIRVHDSAETAQALRLHLAMTAG